MTARRLGLALAAAVALLGARRAAANTCSFSAVTGVAFGSYNVFDTAPVVAAGGFTYECTGVGASDQITIELGGDTDATVLRAMASGANTLSYQLYLDAPRTVVWGNGTGGTATYGPVHPANATPTSVSIFGRIPARQDAVPGSYHDTVVITVNF